MTFIKCQNGGRKMSKKIFSLLPVICMLFCLSACGTTETSSNPTNTPFESQTNATQDNNENASSGGNNQVSSNIEDSKENVNSQVFSNIEETKENHTTQTSTNQSKPTNSTNPSTHTHSFSNATCISPKKCSCGATSGKALGHKWTEANCKAPKTCSVCKTIDGDKGKHEYSENTGICYICNEKDANFKFKALENTGKWIYSFNKTDIYEGNILVVFTFDFSVPGISWMVLGKEATPEEASNESIYTYDYNGKTYISLGGNGEYMEYEENGSEVTATYTGSYDEPKIYFKRTANDTLKIIGIDKEFPYEEHFVIGVEIKTSN